MIHDPYADDKGQDHTPGQVGKSGRDKDSLEAKTRTVRDNGFNPVWNEVDLPFN